MDAALLLAALASRAGDRVDLLAYDRRVRALVQGRAARDVLPSLVNAMATLEPELIETDARGLTATALRTAPRRSLIVLLTSLDAAPIEEGLLPVLPQLTQRHTVLVASVADPHIARWQHPGEIPKPCTRPQPPPRHKQNDIEPPNSSAATASRLSTQLRMNWRLRSRTRIWL